MFLKIGLVLLIATLCCCQSSTATANPNDLGIIGGHEISIEKAPYMASLRLDGVRHCCGASIIHDQFVLTAAHCIKPFRRYRILVGTNKVDNGGKLYNVVKIITHESYSKKTNDNDICVLKLNETLTFGPTVKKIGLIDMGRKIITGTMLETTGWGYTAPQGKFSNTLKQVSVPLVSPKLCKVNFVRQMNITRRMICAGGNGKDACSGDSGGPLTFKSMQVGITSCGAGCGQQPGIYAKISSFLPWINKTIEQNLH